jgi:Multicopper oxidase
VIIAFKADNPGAWLVHCHIATHISAGLGLQIMERREDAQKIWPSIYSSQAIRDVTDGCEKWNAWWGDCNNWWPGDGSACPNGLDNAFPDSGV